MEQARLVRHHGEPAQYRYKRLGYNFRMTEIQAALGQVQLKKLDKFNEIRIRWGKYLNEKLEPLEGIQIPYVAPRVRHVYHVYAPLLDADKLGISNNKFMEKLQSHYIRNQSLSKKILIKINVHFLAHFITKKLIIPKFRFRLLRKYVKK